MKTKLKEIVINKQFGGFGLSYEGVMEYAKNKGITLYAYEDKRDANGNIIYNKVDRLQPYTGSKDTFIIYYLTKPINKDGSYKEKDWFSESDISRDDPALIKTVKELKSRANGDHATLEIVKIPADVEYEIDEYDGLETIHEKHRSWG